MLDIELARIYDGVNLPDYLPAFEIAAELGCRQVISSVWTENRAYAAEQFAALCDLARPIGLTINLEPVSWSGAHRPSRSHGVCSKKPIAKTPAS